MSTSLEEKLNKILENEIPSRHSYFQLEYFVIGKCETLQAKLWQCLREIKSRKESIDAITLEIEEQKDQLELLVLQAEEHSNTEFVAPSTKREKENGIRARQLARKKKSLENSLKELQKRLQYTSEETEFFINMFEEISKVETLKPLDDLQSQKNYWNEKLGQELNMRALLNMPLDLELVKTVLALPEGEPIKTRIKNTLGQIQDYMIKLEHERKGIKNGN